MLDVVHHPSIPSYINNTFANSCWFGCCTFRNLRDISSNPPKMRVTKFVELLKGTIESWNIFWFDIPVLVDFPIRIFKPIIDLAQEVVLEMGTCKIQPGTSVFHTFPHVNVSYIGLKSLMLSVRRKTCQLHWIHLRCWQTQRHLP